MAISSAIKVAYTQVAEACTTQESKAIFMMLFILLQEDPVPHR